MRSDRYASWEDPTSSSDPLLGAHRIELGVWALCAAVSVCVLMHTLALEFPARALALQGECVTLAIVAALGLASLRRVAGAAASSKQSPRAQVAGVTLRVAFGVPAFLFALVVSASGFAA